MHLTMRELRHQGYNLNADDPALHSFLEQYRRDPNRESTMFNKTVEDDSQRTCTIGYDTLFINQGDVRLCPSFPSIGNTVQESRTLQEIWHSPQAHKVRKGIRQCRQLCTLSCLRQARFLHKVKTSLKM